MLGDIWGRGVVEPEGSYQHILFWVIPRFFEGNQTFGHELLHQGVIGAQRYQLFIAYHVGAAIAHVGDGYRRCREREEPGCDHSRPHAAQFRCHRDPLLNGGLSGSNRMGQDRRGVLGDPSI